MAANTTTTATSTEPPKDDLTHWIDRFKAALADTQSLMKPSHPQASRWHNRTLECFEPIDTCLITCCIPAVTFGKTHHRLHHDANLRDFSPLNISCLGFCFGCCGINLAMSILQRREIRERFNLEGDCIQDTLRSCCCICCTLVQADKEAAYQLANHTDLAMTQPSGKKDEMSYPSAAVTTTPAPTSDPAQV